MKESNRKELRHTFFHLFTLDAPRTLTLQFCRYPPPPPPPLQC